MIIVTTIICHRIKLSMNYFLQHSLINCRNMPLLEVDFISFYIGRASEVQVRAGKKRLRYQAIKNMDQLIKCNQASSLILSNSLLGGN